MRNLTWMDWLALILVVGSIVALAGWAAWDLMHEQVGEPLPWPDDADSLLLPRIVVYRRRPLYDWQAEGDL